MAKGIIVVVAVIIIIMEMARIPTDYGSGQLRF
jgi:hypothetical protein